MYVRCTRPPSLGGVYWNQAKWRGSHEQRGCTCTWAKICIYNGATFIRICTTKCEHSLVKLVGSKGVYATYTLLHGFVATLRVLPAAVFFLLVAYRGGCYITVFPFWKHPAMSALTKLYKCCSESCSHMYALSCTRRWDESIICCAVPHNTHCVLL